MKRTVKVSIEETLCHTYEVEVDLPEDASTDDILDEAIEIAGRKYRDEEFVLYSDDFTGKLAQAEYNDACTDWRDF